MNHPMKFPWSQSTSDKKWKRRDLMLLLERLELYVSSGLSVDEALRICAEGMPLQQRQAIGRIKAAVESGSPVSAALSRSLGLPQTYAGLIEHGESSGQLARTIGMARALMERHDELIKKCLSAMAYPCIIGAFALLLTFGLVRGVMPQIIPMLKSLHVQLPILTRIVIAVSEGMTGYGVSTASILLFCYIGSAIAYRRSERFKRSCHSLLIRMPIIGRLIQLYALTAFLQSCGSLLESGLPVVKAFAGTARTIAFIPIRLMLESQIASINRGIPLGQVFSDKRITKIAPHIAPLLSAGEASGALGASLMRAASILDRDIDHSLKRLTALIEPMMMAGMGCIVGGIALSIMMPIYDISRVLQH